MRLLTSLLAAAAVLLAGCVPALEPFFARRDLRFDPAILGAWVLDTGSGSWHVARSAEHTLVVTYEARGVRKGFEAHLFQIGAHRFLDLLPRIPVGEADVHWAHFLPAHTVARVWLEGDVLRIAPLSKDWLDARIERGEIAIEHRRTESGVVLTAPTSQLREMLAAIGDDPRAFPPPDPCPAQPGTRTLCIAESASAVIP